MKSPRPKILQQKAQLKTLQDLPHYKRYNTLFTIALGFAVVLAFAIKYRNDTIANDIKAAQDNLAGATECLNGLKQSLFGISNNVEYLANNRSTYYAEGLKLADDAIDSAGDREPNVVAAALVLKGDLNFELANLPELPGASTRPSLQPERPLSELLSNAEDAYSQVLKDYSGNLPQVTAARFGLAAVAEDRALDDLSQWDKAREFYQDVLDSDAYQPFKDLATQKIGLLKDLQKPLALNLMPDLTALPTTEPATMATGASTAPAH
jgi:hypothetical protein